MRGLVFRFPLHHLSIDAHPHVVVLLSGKQCLLVPAFTPGRHKITEAIEALKTAGWREDQVCVYLDNAKAVESFGGFSGHQSCWFVERNYWAAKSKLEAIEPIGAMTDEGLDAIAQCLLRLHEAKPELLSDKHVEMVRQWVKG